MVMEDNRKNSFPERITREVTLFGIALLITLFASSILEAHESAHTHPALAAASLELLDEPTTLGTAEASSILQGTIDEDDGEYRETLRSCLHFFNPITGGNLIPSNPFCGTVPMPGANTARDMADIWWREAIAAYSDMETYSFHSLGRVLHLLQDMTTPAHVHDDAHGGVQILDCAAILGSIDGFENWGWCPLDHAGRIQDYIEFTIDPSDQVVAGAATVKLKLLLSYFSIQRSIMPIDISPRGFIDEVAELTYRLTTYGGVLAFEDNQPDSELHDMFPGDQGLSSFRDLHPQVALENPCFIG